MAREYAPEALRTLAEISKNGSSESARVTASVALLDRGYGKPTQSHELTGANGGPIQHVDLTQVSDAQLDTLEAIFGPLAAAGDDDAADPGRTGETTH